MMMSSIRVSLGPVGSTETPRDKFVTKEPNYPRANILSLLVAMKHTYVDGCFTVGAGTGVSGVVDGVVGLGSLPVIG